MASSDLTFDITAHDNASAAVGKVAAALQRMDRTAKTADGSHRQLATSTGRVASGMRTMVGVLGGVATGYAAIKIAQFGKDSIRAASDLQEATSATGVMFGKQKKEIVSWANTAAQAFGQSRTQAMQSATYFGTLAKAAGLTGREVSGFSKELTVLGTDLASFFNTSPAEAIDALGAGLRGESEPLRRYGVLLDDATLKARALKMGIYSGTGTLTQQQRVLAAHAEILRQTSKAQGDFTRTQSGWANQTRVFSAQLENLKSTAGKALLPIATQYIRKINDAMPQLEGSIRRVAPDIGRALVGVSDAVADNWPEIKSIFSDVADAAQRVGGVLKGVWDAFNSLPPGVRDAAVQLGAIATAMKLISKTGIGSALSGGFSLGKSVLGGGGMSSVKAMTVNAGVVNVNGKSVGGPGGPGAGGPGAKPVPGGGMPGWLAGGVAAAMNPWLAGLATAILTKLNVDRAADRSNAGDRRPAPEGTVGMPGAGGGGWLGSRFVSDGNKAADAARRAGKEIKSVNNTMAASLRVVAASAKAQADYRRALTNSTRAGQQSEAGIRSQSRESLRNRAALTDQGRAASRLVALLRGSGAASQQVTARQRQLGSAFIRTAKDMGVPTKQARDLARSYGLLPPKKDTKVTASGAKNSKRDIDNHNKAANGIPGKKDTKVGAPGARGATDDIKGVSAAAGAVPGDVPVNVSVSGAADAESSLRSVAAAAGSVVGTYIATTIHRTINETVNKADGGPIGYITGPGNQTSDNIDARLSLGEFVLRAAAVDAIGLPRLLSMNRTGRIPSFADGGGVTIRDRPIEADDDRDYTPAERAEINRTIRQEDSDYQRYQAKRRRKPSEQYKKGDSDKTKAAKDRAYESRMRELDNAEERASNARQAKSNIQARIDRRKARAKEKARADKQAADEKARAARDAKAERDRNALDTYQQFRDEATAGIGSGLSAAKSFASVSGFDLNAASQAQEELRLARESVNSASTPAERAAALKAAADAEAKVASTAVTPANVKAFMTDKLAKIRQFRDALRGLKDRGLNPTTLSEIAAMNPDDGLTLAQAITASDLADINSLQSDILTVGGDYGLLAHNANVGADAAARSVIDNIIAGGGVNTTINVNSQLYLDGKQIYESLLSYGRRTGRDVFTTRPGR